MVKKFKSYFVLFVALCLMMVLAACGSSKSQESKDTVVQQTDSSAERTESKESDVRQTEESEPSQAVAVTEEEELESVENQTTGKDILVVYFSATGTTKSVAEKIADITDADLYEIVPAEGYSAEDLDYNDDSSRTSMEMNDPDARPEIGSETISLEGYSTLYIGYPIWWGEAPRIMSTFVESYDFDSITVIPFCTSGSSGIGESGDNLAQLAGSGTWLAGERFSGSVSEEELKEWIESLQE